MVEATADSAVDHVANALRERIKQGVMSPGHRLVERDLTSELGVSRGPLREALRRLSAEGLVTITPHQGAMVKRMSQDDIRFVYEVREMIEGLTARLAATNIDRPSARKRVAASIARMEGFLDGHGTRAYMEEDSAFHTLITELAENPVARDILATFSTQVYRHTIRYLFDERSRIRSCAQHIAVGNAVLEGDGNKAERLMRQHVQTSCQEVLKLIG